MHVAIIGATGYGGNELYRLLRQHPHVSKITLYSSSQDQTPIRSVYPHIQTSELLQLIDNERIASEVDCLFLAAPHGVATKLVPPLAAQGVKIIDLSGDFRLKDGAAYEQWYKTAAAPVEWRAQAVYGLTEWAKEDVKSASLIANPGCFPTATLLGLLPALPYIDATSIIVDAKTGVSGAGRTGNVATSFSEVNDNVKIYKVQEHQHTPEIEQQLGVEPITFHTHLIPMTRGIMATIYATVKEPIDWQAHYEETYKDAPFVHVRPHNEFPQTKDVQGSNDCHLAVKYDARTNRLTIVSVIDNLMKGAAGQAVHNMNVMFNLTETAGLGSLPLYP